MKTLENPRLTLEPRAALSVRALRLFLTADASQGQSRPRAGCCFIMDLMKASVPNVTPKKRGGRRAEFTQAQVERALAAAGGLVTSTAKRLGCAPKTVYRYIERFPALRHVLAEARESSVDLAESKLIEAIKNDNLTAIIFFLKTQGKSRGYSERSEPDLTTNGEPFKFTIKINGKTHNGGE